MGREERFPVWEAALGAGVAAAFAAGLVGVYLSMPDSDYSFLKLPRNLEELQILTYVSRAPTHTLFISCSGRCPVSFVHESFHLSFFWGNSIQGFLW